jgi:hypothetical protein
MVARRAQLADQRAAAQARRLQIWSQRTRLREAIDRMRKVHVLSASSTSVPHVLVDRALAMAGITVDEFWVDYFALGGNLDRAGFTAAIAGAGPLVSRDYDFMACALNERFANAGFGYPLDYWDEMPTHRRTQSDGRDLNR